MPSGGQIRVLPVHVVNKIAAGEVVERPASVVKELLENAMDAGATQVRVEIAAGGRKLVAVTDNGHGMNRDDALLSIERHSTSKIRDVDDIERIATLGFRGEALAAIASVSRFRLTTCAAGETVGTEVRIAGGKLADVCDAGCPVGTSVEVRDLFFNVPARRKFLRSHATEMAHVTAAFVAQALARPAIGMTLVVDGRDAYALAAGAELADRIRDLFGPAYVEHLCTVLHQAGEVRVRGYVALPTVTRPDRNEQFVFVNQRITSAPVVGLAIREAYRSRVPRDRYPAVFLHLDVPPDQVDVNVHPTKREVRFRQPGEIRDAVIEAIRSAAQPGTESAESRPAPGSSLLAAAQAAAARSMTIENLPQAPTFAYPRLPDPASRVSTDGPVHPDESGRLPEPGTTGAVPASQISRLAPSSPSAIRNPQSAIADASSPWSWCRVLGQVGGLYVVLETEDGLVLMDPHAAHERVLYERYMADFQKGTVETQGLLIPETVEFEARDAVRVRDQADRFRQMGFGLSEFGGGAFVVDALPACLGDVSAKPLFVEIAHALEEAGARGGKGRYREEAIARAACRSAVKARDVLSLSEIEQLVVSLARAEMPYTCPHGRPTLIFTSFQELARKFGRE